MPWGLPLKSPWHDLPDARERDWYREGTPAKVHEKNGHCTGIRCKPVRQGFESLVERCSVTKHPDYGSATRTGCMIRYVAAVTPPFLAIGSVSVMRLLSMLRMKV